jgi:hypothetical protein
LTNSLCGGPQRRGKCLEGEQALGNLLRLDYDGLLAAVTENSDVSL